MFVNFTNHPSGSWGAAQRRAAQVYGEILDLPFPDVPPALSAAAVAALADEWAARILALRPACVLCQGEMTLTARVVRLLQSRGVPAAPPAAPTPTAAPTARRSSASSNSGNIPEPLKIHFAGGETPCPTSGRSLRICASRSTTATTIAARRTDTPPPVLPSIHPIPKEAYHVFLR